MTLPRAGERALRAFARLCALLSVLTTVGIVWTLLRGAVPFFRAVPPLRFLLGTEWRPTASPPAFGVLPLAWGTLVVTLGAGLFAMPVGLLTAIYLREVARPAVRRTLKPLVETLAGIPAVVYGYLGLSFVTPGLRRVWPETQATNALAGAIVVGIMVLPVVSSLCEEALGAVPAGLRDAADGLGSTRTETTLRIVLPSARRGILAAFALAASRALGETIAVALAAGGSPSLSLDPRRSVETMGAFIVGASEGDAATGSTKYTALFAVGAALFALTLALNLVAARLVRRLA